MIIWSKNKITQMRGNKGMRRSHKVIWVVILMIQASLILMFFLLSCVAAKISKNTVHSIEELKKPHKHPSLQQYVMPPPCYAFQTIPMWVQSQNAHANKHRHWRWYMLQVWVWMFCIGSLMVIWFEDYPFWEQWFPNVTAGAHFHVSERDPEFPGTHTH